MTGRESQALATWIVMLTASLMWHVFPAARTALDVTAVIAILVLGLPHGALDLIDLRGSSEGRRSLTTVTLVYVALLLLAAMSWWLDPRVALLAFLIVAITHFATEWGPDLPRPANWPAAALIVAAPASAHPEEVSRLFFALSADRAWADTLTWTAAVITPFLIVAFLTVIATRKVDISEGAMIMGLGLAALLLPPLLFFVVFFVVVHSPRHIMVAADHHGWDARTVAVKAAPMTALACFVFIVSLWIWRDTQAGPAVFLLLAVLTVPHIFTPWVLRRVMT